MYLAFLKNEHNLYEILVKSRTEKDNHERVIFYEYEKNELLDYKLFFFVVPVIANDNKKVLFFLTQSA
jgi:hypothetical protein